VTSPEHVPVLLDRVVALLEPALDRSGAVLVDATLGLGGHSEAVLTRCEPARVVGIDRDPAALELAGRRLAGFGDRFTPVHAVYDEIPDVLVEMGLAEVDAVLFDLGVSSMQLDESDRGFAYATDAPLDMRMDPTGGPTAADVLNTYPRADLARLLRVHGDERFARQIAAAVVREREREPFTTSGRLVELVYAVIPAPARRTGGHPAKRTFQALRMEVNDELSVLRRAVPAAVNAIRVGGRVVVESYHSGEDRIVKRVFAAAARTDVPDDLPFVPEGHEPVLRLVTRGAEKAGTEEVRANPRAASVRLRAAERVRPGPVSLDPGRGGQTRAGRTSDRHEGAA
jgi:16S rRNA (cytosine1402-N4)-methyltransferase